MLRKALYLEVTREESVLLRSIGSVQDRQHVTLLVESTAGFLHA